MSDWYYAADNEQKGPINESELKANLATNKLPADTLVWKDGMENWTPANQVAAFSFRPPPAPAKIQPPAAGSVPVAAETPAAAPAGSNPDSTVPVDLTKISVGPGEALEVDAEDAEVNKIYGILAYVGILVLVPFFAAKESPFARYHTKQGFVLLVAWVALAIVMWVISLIFLFIPGLYLLYQILTLVYLVPLGLTIYGIINAAAGKCVPLPVIGGIKLGK